MLHNKNGMIFRDMVSTVMEKNPNLDKDTVEKVCSILEDAGYRQAIIERFDGEK